MMRKYGLCLKRKPGQSIVIETAHGQVVITFIRMASHFVQMRFSMPDSVRVLREEVLNRQQQMEGVKDDEPNGNA